jgi:hypothetical protein
MNVERFEFKYLIPSALTDSIRAFIRPYCVIDPYAERETDGYYSLRALYLDAPDYKTNWDKIMSYNTSRLADNAGDFDPWIELQNLGPGKVNLSGFYLTDDVNNPTKWALPPEQVSDGQIHLYECRGSDKRHDQAFRRSGECAGDFPLREI